MILRIIEGSRIFDYILYLIYLLKNATIVDYDIF